MEKKQVATTVNMQFYKQRHNLKCMHNAIMMKSWHHNYQQEVEK